MVLEGEVGFPERTPTKATVKMSDYESIVKTIRDRGFDLDKFEESRECPDEESIGAWLDGMLGEAEREAVESHVSGCVNCQHLVTVFAKAPGVDPSELPSLSKATVQQAHTIGRVVAGPGLFSRIVDAAREAFFAISWTPAVRWAAVPAAAAALFVAIFAYQATMPGAPDRIELALYSRIDPGTRGEEPAGTAMAIPGEIRSGSTLVLDIPWSDTGHHLETVFFDERGEIVDSLPIRAAGASIVRIGSRARPEPFIDVRRGAEVLLVEMRADALLGDRYGKISVLVIECGEPLTGEALASLASAGVLDGEGVDDGAIEKWGGRKLEAWGLSRFRYLESSSTPQG